MKKFKDKISLISIFLLMFFSCALVFSCGILVIHKNNFLQTSGAAVPFVLRDENSSAYYINGKIASSPAVNEKIVKQQLNGLKSSLNLGDATQNLSLLNIHKLNNSKVYRFNQTYKNINVYGKQIIAVSDASNYINNVVVDVSENLDLDTESKYSASQIMFNVMENQEYKNCEILSVNKTIYTLYNYTPTLAYVVSIQMPSDSLNVYADVIIDANTAKEIITIPRSSASIQSYQTDGLGQIRDVEISFDEESNKYYLYDESRNIYVYDAKNATSGSANLVESSNGKFSDPYAVSLFANLKECYDFYKNENNIGVSLNGPDNKGMDIVGIIHFGTNYENASWSTNDGTENDKDPNKNEGMIVVGDGGQTFKNLSMGLDVLGHEYQHAITTYTANLIYFNASGALDEGFSNIFGALIENKTGDDFWYIGEDIMKTAPCLYDLSNPYNCLSPAPKSLSDRNFVPFCTQNHIHFNCDNGGVHTNSSILTYAAYLMTQNNPEFFTNQKIGELFYNTLILLPSAASFNHARVACVTAAENLGYPSEIITGIKTAFRSVGVLGEEHICTVSYNGNGNTGGVLPDNDYVAFGNTLKVANDIGVEKTNYLFKCWNTRADGRGTNYYAGDDIFVEDDTILYAVWILDLWDNSEVRSFAKGDGGTYTPYEITNVSELSFMAFAINNNLTDEVHGGYYKTKKFILKNNITLNNKSWIPIGTTEHPFEGKFDGNGFGVYDLTINSSEFNYNGLFGCISNASIFNITVNGRGSMSENYWGGIVGKAENSSIYNSTAKLNVNTAYKFGGIVSTANNTSILNCYSEGYVTTADTCGGIAAITNNVSILNCYNKMDLAGSFYCGGIVAYATQTKLMHNISLGTLTKGFNMGGIVARVEDLANNFASIINCFNAGNIIKNASGISYVGGVVGYSQIKLEFENNYYKQNNSYASIGNSANGNEEVGISSEDELYEGVFNFDNETYYSSAIFSENYTLLNFDFKNVWNLPVLNEMPTLKFTKFNINLSKSLTKTEAENTYNISSVEDLNLLSYYIENEIKNENNIYYANCNYNLTNNIDLSGLYFNSIGGNHAFKGVFNGNYFNISGLTQISVSSAAFFGSAEQATVKNLNFENVNIFGGLSSDVAVVSNNLKNTFISEIMASGMLCGNSATGVANVGQELIINNSTFNLQLFGKNNVAAICNDATSGNVEINNVIASGSYLSATSVAGLVNLTSEVNIKNTIVSANLKLTKDEPSCYVGGAIGIHAVKVPKTKSIIKNVVQLNNCSFYNQAVVGELVAESKINSLGFVIENCTTLTDVLVGIKHENIIFTNNEYDDSLTYDKIMSSVYSTKYFEENAWSPQIWQLKDGLIVIKRFYPEFKIELSVSGKIANEIIEFKNTNTNIYVGDTVKFKLKQNPKYDYSKVVVKNNNKIINLNTDGYYEISNVQESLNIVLENVIIINNYYYIVIIAVVLVLIVVGGYFIYKAKKQKKNH